jgi:hypothetical protein
MGVQFGGEVDKLAHVLHPGANPHANAPRLGFVGDAKGADFLGLDPGSTSSKVMS